MFEDSLENSAPIAVLIIVGAAGVLAGLLYGLETGTGILCAASGIASIMMGGYIHYM